MESAEIAGWCTKFGGNERAASYGKLGEAYADNLVRHAI